MKKIILPFLFCLLFIAWGPSPVFAQNKVGINIGDHFDEFDRAARTVGPGGWVVLMACPGDADKIASLMNSHPEVNVIIRGHYPGQKLTRNWALTWVGTLGNLPTPNKIYFMPWNEPNQAGSSDWGNPAEVVSYINYLVSFLDEAKLRGDKVKLLSPMINQSHPNFSSYIQDLRKIDSDFFSQLDGIAMNLYDFGEEDCGQPLCSDDPHRNPQRFAEILAEMGAQGKSAFGAESGTAGQNFYWKTAPSSNSPLYRFVDNFKTVGAKMFAIPAYDLGGERSHTWSLFSPMDTANLLNSTGQQQGPCCTEAASSVWNKNFITQYSLITCPNGVTVGPEGSNCLGCATSTTPSPSCPTPATEETDSRPNLCEPCYPKAPVSPFCAETPTVSKTFSYPASAGPDLSFTLDGSFSLDPSSLVIPFVGKEGEENEMKYLADYFEGTFFDYHYGPKPENPALEMMARSGVFRKLAPQEIQDQLKRKMILRASGFDPNNPVHDYLVTNYEGESAHLSEFLNNMRPENTAAERDWRGKDGGKWYRLWPYVPMFTREDSPGYVTLTVEQPGTVGNPGPFAIQVPHTARLYEITKKIAELLVPQTSQEEQVSISSQPGSYVKSRFQSLNPSSQSPFTASTNPNNLLENPDFEEGFSPYGGVGELEVANGWHPWWRQGSQEEVNEGYFRRPEYKPEDGQVYTDPLRVCSGRFGQKFFNTYATHEAGFFQQVNVPAGEKVTFSVWAIAWSSSEDDAHACVGGKYPLSVGIDPNGGTDWQSSSIVWSSPITVCNAPVQLTVTTAAQSGTITVFSKGAPEWRVKHNDSYWDNACLVVGETSELPLDCFICNATGGGVTECSYPEAETGEGDPLCFEGEVGKGISSRVTATDKITHTPKTLEEIATCVANCLAGGGNPVDCYNSCAFATHTVERKIGVTFYHPFLYEIWQQTTGVAQGLFNIFRSSDPDLGPPPGDDTPAYGTVSYSFGGGDIDKTEAKVYFPFLEGVRKVKDWVVNEVLVPAELQTQGAP